MNEPTELLPSERLDEETFMKIKTFDDIQTRGTYVGLIPPTASERTESNIELPPQAQGEKNVPLQKPWIVACLGDEVDDLQTGDAVYVAEYFQPAQRLDRTWMPPHNQPDHKLEDVEEDIHLFVVEAGQIVMKQVA